MVQEHSLALWAQVRQGWHPEGPSLGGTLPSCQLEILNDFYTQGPILSFSTGMAIYVASPALDSISVT